MISLQEIDNAKKALVDNNCSPIVCDGKNYYLICLPIGGLKTLYGNEVADAAKSRFDNYCIENNIEWKFIHGEYGLV